MATASTFAVVTAKVNYAVTAVNFSSVATTSLGGPVNGTFQVINNLGFNGGTQPVSWTVYASTTPNISGSSVLLASGATPALASGATSPVIPFAGTWPATPNYFLVISVSVQVDQEQNPANDTVAIFDEALSNTTNNAFATATSMGITLQSGISMQVMGYMAAGITDNYLSFGAGTAGTITFSMVWATSASVTLSVLDATPTILDSASASGTSLSLMWTIDANQVRYVHINTTGAPGVYTLTITHS
jgi:hypothetical protein